VYLFCFVLEALLSNMIENTCFLHGHTWMVYLFSFVLEALLSDKIEIT